MSKSKLIPILKASMYGNMNIFKVGKKKNKETIKDKLGRLFVLVILTLTMMALFGMYAGIIIGPLKQVNMEHVVITIFGLVSTILVFIQGVYRAQGVLFDAKDSDMLFSMPIKKSTIFASRLIKLITFQYVWNIIIMLPVFLVYAIFIKPAFTFYLTAIIMLITLPIIPTILASVLAYIIQSISSRFKMKKAVQMIGTIVFTVIVFIFSFNMQDYLENIASKAQTINDIIIKIYYPLGIYDQCIIDFNIVKLGLLLIANLVIVGIYIFIFSHSYYKIISRLSEKHSKSNYKMKALKTSTALGALTKKELKRYFTSPVYVMNTIFGPIMLIIGSVYAVVSSKGFIEQIPKEFGDIMGFLPKVLMIFIMFTLSIATTTSSSISLEGKTFWLTKSLPVSEKKIFISKIMVNLIITIPFAIVSSILLAIVFKFKILDIFYCIATSIIVPLLVSILGLVVNLKYPKMDAISDTAVVKQSMSSMISVYSGLLLTAIPIIFVFILQPKNIDIYAGLMIVIYTVFTYVLWKVLTTYGVRKFKKIN